VGYSVWDSVMDSARDSVGYSVRDSVGNSVENSVGNSVGNSVWNSVMDSARDSVGYSVWDSVWDFVRAYTGSFFGLKRKDWKYTSKIRTTDYPFRSAVTLWEMGLVPSFDGEIWRLHGGKNAEVLFQISQKDLKKWKPKEVKP